jgi:hypothetical protein
MVKNKFRDGFGVEYDEDKVAYRGEFCNGLYSGWGQTLKYQGEFKEGKKNGWGKWNDHAKNIEYEGFFKDDQFHGLGYLNVSSNEIRAFMEKDEKLASNGALIKYAGEWANGKF